MEKLDLQKDGVTYLTYPTQLKSAVAEAAKMWQLFCELPYETKALFNSSDSFNSIGYELKDGSTESKDKKENFDITSDGATELTNRALEAPDHSKVVEAFFSAARTLVAEATPAIEQFGSIVESDFGIDGFEALAHSSAPSAFFRFLHYPSAKSIDQSIIAEPHTDHSGFTLHLYESTDGCERLLFDGVTWAPLPLSEGKAVAFSGMQTQLVSEGEITALCHRVIANETTEKFGRFAVVCFVSLEGIAKHDRVKNGRLQDKKPGFNYGVNPEEFSKLFIK